MSRWRSYLGDNEDAERYRAQRDARGIFWWAIYIAFIALILTLWVLHA